MFKNHQEKQMLVGGLLLAAGGSTRFGSPKQLAKFRGKTLMRRSAEAIFGSGCSLVVVVLGACIEECRKEIEGLVLNVAINDQWQTGMASSIKTGLAKLLELKPDLDAVLITLMDQPLVSAKHLARIVDRFNCDRTPIVATGYNDITGVPALFYRGVFVELENLGGEKGAKELIRGKEHVAAINLSEAAIDIDRPEDLSRL